MLHRGHCWTTTVNGGARRSRWLAVWSRQRHGLTTCMLPGRIRTLCAVHVSKRHGTVQYAKTTPIACMPFDHRWTHTRTRCRDRSTDIASTSTPSGLTGRRTRATPQAASACNLVAAAKAPKTKQRRFFCNRPLAHNARMRGTCDTRAQKIPSHTPG